jgi:hypothetical protein
MEPPEESPSASQRAASPDSDSELTAPPTDDLKMFGRWARLS